MIGAYSRRRPAAAPRAARPRSAISGELLAVFGMLVLLVVVVVSVLLGVVVVSVVVALGAVYVVEGVVVVGAVLAAVLS